MVARPSGRNLRSSWSRHPPVHSPPWVGSLATLHPPPSVTSRCVRVGNVSASIACRFAHSPAGTHVSSWGTSRSSTLLPPVRFADKALRA